MSVVSPLSMSKFGVKILGRSDLPLSVMSLLVSSVDVYTVMYTLFLVPFCHVPWYVRFLVTRDQPTLQQSHRILRSSHVP